MNFVSLKKVTIMHGKILLNILRFLLVFILSIFSSSQTADIQLRYDDFVYDNNIKSIRFHRLGFEFSLPVIELNKEENFILTFDDISAKYKRYFYTFDLCDFSWQPVNLPKSDYLSGFYFDEITDYRFSKNTRVPYINYTLVFPNENIKPTRSGNYILKVWYEYSGENILAFTRRFFIIDGKINITATVFPATEISSRWIKQEVDFVIDSQNMNIVNPIANLKVAIIQNQKWTNGIFTLKPRFIKGDIFDYNYNGENTFYAGNEFRSFDIKSTGYQTAEIDGIRIIDGIHHVFLSPDVIRNYTRYAQKSDINGRFYIKTDDFINSDIEAEYVYVYFTLLSHVPRTDGDIFVSGDFTKYQLTDEFKMKYNYERKAYELTLLLKQGFYDYEYVFLPHDKVIGNYTELEGNFSETENDYSIWVYYRRPGEFYCELIGVLFLNSRE